MRALFFRNKKKVSREETRILFLFPSLTLPPYFLPPFFQPPACLCFSPPLLRGHVKLAACALARPRFRVFLFIIEKKPSVRGAWLPGGYSFSISFGGGAQSKKNKPGPLSRPQERRKNNLFDCCRILANDIFHLVLFYVYYESQEARLFFFEVGDERQQL